ncbi:LysR family transcriptional regulator [Solibacillus sp. MA9]|uniref:LysR family transcriptional regulator n=1 Tax=Solibacillus palustris TaxID=2908203 RepID=A0ABS9UB01_9BACL|nr:LysR family transcriptional regulator [Solibacillus sp. MA9]MCH7321509.1 LysR family transcriptional regulator [Solibacillus sp. MA9]
MDLKWLKSFVTVYEEGSFRAAAEKLFISQPSITVHIKALEEELQVALFQREHTKVRLTMVGEQYYPIAKKLLAHVEESKNEIRIASSNQKTRLIIALSAALISTDLLKVIHNFIASHSKYEVEMIMEDGNHLDGILRNRQADVVICLQKTKSKDLHSERLIRSPMKLVYSSKIRLEGNHHDQQIKWLLENYPLYIGYLDEHTPILESLEREYNVRRYNKVLDSIFAIKLMNEGLGIGLLPEFQIKTELTEGKLKVLDIGAIASIYPIDIYMSHLRNNMNLNPFLRFVRAQVE